MHRKTLLLINSSQVLMDITKKILERADYSVCCAAGLAGAREQLMDLTPDMIILENDLPDGKGLDYCRELRRESAVPIMLLSNIKDDELPALQAGATDFLKKPFDFEIMKARISVMLNTRVSSRASGGDEDIERNAVMFTETNETGRRLQSVQEKSGDESEKKRKPSKFMRLYMTIAACFAFVFIGVGIFNALNNNPYVFIPDEQIPLAGFSFQMEENAKPYTGAEQGIRFPGINSVTVPADTTNVKMLLLNPEGNPCYFDFEIILNDTEESLFSSGMVEPGMCIEEIAFSKGLVKGEYNAVIKIRAYALEGFTVLNGANMEFCLTAI